MLSSGSSKEFWATALSLYLVELLCEWRHWWEKLAQEGEISMWRNYDECPRSICLHLIYKIDESIFLRASPRWTKVHPVSGTCRSLATHLDIGWNDPCSKHVPRRPDVHCLYGITHDGTSIRLTVPLLLDSIWVHQRGPLEQCERSSSSFLGILLFLSTLEKWGPPRDLKQLLWMEWNG